MEFIICDDYDKMSDVAAKIIADQIKEKNDSVLGLATGSTPIGTYERLVEMNKNNEISFSEIKTFNLDEYAGLDPQNDQSYRWFMNHHLFDHIDINKKNTHVPSGLAENGEEMCEQYEHDIEAAGGLDLQLLGLGHNGHIGFNEPDEDFPIMTHKVDLTESTIEANSRLFDSIDEVPRQAFTMGIGTIMKAKKIVLVASGKDKAEIVKKAFKGEVDPQVPASILQSHGNAIIVLDAQAASLL